MSIFQDSLSSTSADTKPNITPSLVVQLLRTIAYVDNYIDVLPFLSSPSVPVLGSGVFWLKYILTHSIYAFGTLTGWALGYQTWMKEYTPKEHWEIADKGALGGYSSSEKKTE